MRNLRIILSTIMLLGCYGLSAQHYVGIRGGYGAGTARFTPNEETGFQWGLASAGLSYKYYPDKPRFVGAVEVDLILRQNGFKYFLTSDRDTSYHRTVNSVEIPLMWQPHVNFFNNRARFFINLGVNFYYHMDSKEWYQNAAGVKYDQNDYNFGITKDNRFGYGLCGGAGLSYITGRLEFSAEMRYNFGYSDILKSRSQNKDNKWNRSPIDNLSGYLAVYYRLGRDENAAPRIRQTRAEKAELRRARKEFNESIPQNDE